MAEDSISQDEINELLSGKYHDKDKIIPKETLRDIEVSIPVYGVGKAGMVFRNAHWKIELGAAGSDRNPTDILFSLMAAQFDGKGSCEIEEYIRKPKSKCIVSTIDFSCKPIWSADNLSEKMIDQAESFYSRPLLVRIIKDVKNIDGNYEKHEFRIPLNIFCCAVIKAIDKLIDKYGLLGFYFSWNGMRAIELTSYLYVKAMALKKYDFLEKLGKELMVTGYEDNNYRYYYSDFQEEMKLLSVRL